MMTREQRILRIVSTLRPTDPGSWGPNTHYVTMEFNAHDAEQRAEIARLKHDYGQLKEAYDAKVAGIPLGPIVGAQTIINQQMEIARLRAALGVLVDQWEHRGSLTIPMQQAQQALKETTE